MLVAVGLDDELRTCGVHFPEPQCLEGRVALSEEQEDSACADASCERRSVPWIDRAALGHGARGQAPASLRAPPVRSRSRTDLHRRSRWSGSPPMPARSPSRPRSPVCTGSTRSAGSSRRDLRGRLRSGIRAQAFRTTRRWGCRPSPVPPRRRRSHRHSVACAAFPGLSVQGAPDAGAVAVFIALFVSPGDVERIPPKKARSDPSGIRSRSGWDMADQPPRATESPPDAAARRDRHVDQVLPRPVPRGCR